MNATLQLEHKLQERIPTDVQLTAFIKLYNTARAMKAVDEDLAQDLLDALCEQLSLRGMTLSGLFAEAHKRIATY